MRSRVPIVSILARSRLRCCRSLAAGDSFGASGTDSAGFHADRAGDDIWSVAADCAACHTVPDSGQPFAGGRPIETPFGNITSRRTSRLTARPASAPGATSDFDSALRKGIRPNGARLYPAMPYTAYTKMSRDDVLAIRAYLKTVEPVRHPVVDQHAAVPVQHPRRDAGLGSALFHCRANISPIRNSRRNGTGARSWSQGPGIAPRAIRRKRFWAATREASICAARKFRAGSRRISPTMTRTGLGRWSAAGYRRLSEDRPQPRFGGDRPDGGGDDARRRRR